MQNKSIAPQRSNGMLLRGIWLTGLTVVLILLCVIGAIINPYFVSPRILYSIIGRFAPYLFLAFGFAITYLSGTLDLSIIAIYAVCGSVYTLTNNLFGTVPAILICAALGVLTGFFVNLLSCAFRKCTRLIMGGITAVLSCTLILLNQFVLRPLSVKLDMYIIKSPLGYSAISITLIALLIVLPVFLLSAFSIAKNTAGGRRVKMRLLTGCFAGGLAALASVFFVERIFGYFNTSLLLAGFDLLDCLFICAAAGLFTFLHADRRGANLLGLLSVVFAVPLYPILSCLMTISGVANIQQNILIAVITCILIGLNILIYCLNSKKEKRRMQEMERIRLAHAAPSFAPAPCAANSENKSIDLLNTLTVLHDQGLLTDAEFQQKKADILSRF